MVATKALESAARFDKNIGKFYEYSTMFFKFFGIWIMPPGTRKSTKFLILIANIFTVIFWFLLYHFMLLLNIIFHINDLQLVISVIFVLSTYLSCLAKFLKSRICNKKIKEVTEFMADEDFKPITKCEDVIFLEALKENQKVKKVYTVLTLTSFITMGLGALMKGNRTLPCPAYPILDIQKLGNFVLIFMYEELSQGLHCATNIAFDCLFCSFFIYVSCQFRIFKNRIVNIKGSSYDEVHDQLKACVKLHRKILHLNEMVQECVMTPLVMQIVSSTVVIVAIFFGLSKVKRLTFIF